MKYCKDCSYISKLGVCSICSICSIPDMVNGGLMKKTCIGARQEPELCGIEARWFVPKEFIASVPQLKNTQVVIVANNKCEARIFLDKQDFNNLNRSIQIMTGLDDDPARLEGFNCPIVFILLTQTISFELEYVIKGYTDVNPQNVIIDLSS